jgi:hypothetical protein
MLNQCFKLIQGLFIFKEMQRQQYEILYQLRFCTLALMKVISQNEQMPS